MCETLIMYYLCGHIYTKKTWKCSKDIERRLDLANDKEAIRHSSKPFTSIPASSCLGCDVPESFLKPTLCEKCEEQGLIGDWLRSDPAVRFEIVKDWRRVKRADKARLEVSSDAEAHASDEDSALSNNSIDRHIINTSPKHITSLEVGIVDQNDVLESLSPILMLLPSKRSTDMIIQHDVTTKFDTLEVMTPVLMGYLSEARCIQGEVDITVEKVENADRNTVQHQKTTADLRRRAIVARAKLEVLIEKSKHQAAFQALPPAKRPA